MKIVILTHVAVTIEGFDSSEKFLVVSAVNEDLSVVFHGLREDTERTGVEFFLFQLLKLFRRQFGFRFHCCELFNLAMFKASFQKPLTHDEYFLVDLLRISMNKCVKLFVSLFCVLQTLRVAFQGDLQSPVETTMNLTSPSKCSCGLYRNFQSKEKHLHFNKSLIKQHST